MLEFRTFEIVSAIVQAGSLSGAATALSMTQPALTKALSSIETDIGAKLFLRSAGGMQPTHAASVFLRRWDAIRADLIDMRREIDDIRSLDDGVLRIATGYLAASSAEMAIGALSRRFPALKIEARQLIWSDVATAVRRGHVDVGIADPTAAEYERDLHVDVLSERDARFICRADHPLLAQKSPTLLDILRYPMAINLIPYRIARHFPDDVERLGFRRMGHGHLLPQIAVQSMSAIRNVRFGSDAVTIMPRHILRRSVQSGRLAFIDTFAPSWLTVRLGFVTRAQGTQSPAMKAFIDEVRRIEMDQADPDGRTQ